MSEIPSDPESYIKQQIKHHHAWRTRWSFLYFSFAAATIVAGAATTAVAGIYDGDQATRYTVILAAVTTILASLEKVLKFREKWDLHRNVEHAMRLLLFTTETGIPREDVIDRIRQILVNYSDELSGLNRPDPDLSGKKPGRPQIPPPDKEEDAKEQDAKDKNEESGKGDEESIDATENAKG